MFYTLLETSSHLISNVIFGNCSAVGSEFSQEQIQPWSIIFGTEWGKLAKKYKGFSTYCNWFINYTETFQYKLNFLIHKIICCSSIPTQQYLKRVFVLPDKHIFFPLTISYHINHFLPEYDIFNVSISWNNSWN